jgi:hypothetical protein
MAGASAAVGRRKASALRSARAASDDAANSFAPSGALPPLIFLEAKDFLPFVAKARMRVHRENDFARAIRPREAGEEDHWSSRRERTVVEGRRASLSVWEDYSGGAASFYAKANEQA